MTEEQERKILREAQDRLRKAMDEDDENRKLAKDDLEFVAVDGKQWPEQIKAEREAEGRPCITMNKMSAFIDQVVGDQRMNRPSIRVVPVDSQADVKVAKILSGWIKHVQQVSKSDVAIDHGFEHAVACGYGAWRVTTRYSSNSAFEQEAYIEVIENALAVFWGKHVEYDCSDAMYCFIVSDMDRDEFKDKYKVDPMNFNSAGDQFIDGWATKNTVRVAEYFVKVPVSKTIYLLQDGRVVEKPSPEDAVARTRKVQSYKIMWYLLTGDKVLESKEWLGKKYIPVVPVWGKEFNVAGKRRIRGLIRNAKDAQRMYNYWVSIDTETIALQPKSPYILTPKQAAGHEDQWKEAHRKNYPYLLANADKDAPGWPHREAPPQASSAFVEKLRETDQEIRDTIGLQKAALGMQSNERSGAAIRERKKEGDVGTFAFIDNLSRSLEHTGRILVDIAPALLDTERAVRLGLDDGDFEFATVNIVAPDGSILNDLSMGTYDVVVTVGPSFTTQRTEARQSMQEFIQYYPDAAPIIGDLYAKSMDWPEAEQVARRLAFLLPPEIKAQKAAEEARKNGETPPPPVQPPAPPPDPLVELKVQEEQLKVQEMQIKLEQEKIRLAQEQAKLESMKVETELMVRKSKEDIRKMLAEIEKEDNDRADASVDNVFPSYVRGSETALVPGRAEGGGVNANSPYVVGEKGPEVFMPKQDGTIVPVGWTPNELDKRADGSKKGNGFLGVLPIKYPDGSTGVATEYSVGVNMDNQEVDVPTLVPTLTPEETNLMVTDVIPGRKQVPEPIMKKAIEHARGRIGQGLSPFAE